MDQVLQLSFDGLVIGVLYAAIGLGVVIVFRTTNVLNFSQGAVATVAGYVAWSVVDPLEMPYVVALVVAIVVGALFGAAIGALTTFALTKASHLEKSVATLGVFLLMGWGAREVFGDLSHTLPRPFDHPIEIGDVFISGHGIFVIVVALSLIGATFWLLERTRLGLAMRALAQDEETARSHGVSRAVTSLAAWMIASGLAAATGVLVGSFIQVDHTVMTTILIQSIAALVLGGFGSAVGAVIGGVALGIFSSLIAGFASPSYKNTFVFLVILVVLVVRPNGLVGKAVVVVPESGKTEAYPSLPRPGTWLSRGRVIGTGIVVALVALVPVLPHPFSLLSYSVALATAVVVVSLGFFMGYVGEISLGHGALVTIGAYTTALLLDRWESMPYLFVMLAATLAAGVVGGLLGLVTLRLSGIYLAIATLALTFVVVEVALQFSELTGGAAGINAPAPTLVGDIVLSSDEDIYYLTAVMLGVVAVGMAALIRSPAGQRWVAVRDAPVAAASNGVPVKAYKVAAFALSSAVAGLGGSLLAVVVRFVAPFDYDIFFSIFVIVAVIVGGAGSLVGALLGAAFVTLLPVALSRTSGLTDAILGGVLLVLLIAAPGGVRGIATRLHARATRRGLDGIGRAVTIPTPGAGVRDASSARVEEEPDAVRP